jgi:arginine-tRNA-protein transferase
MFDGNTNFINQSFNADTVTPRQLDMLLANGWRHFGTYFFRYSINFSPDLLQIREVIPLRIRLADLDLSRSQRRVLRRNADLKTLIEPLLISPDSEVLFESHRTRFKESVPETIYNFVSPNAGESPCDSRQFRVFDGERLLSESYFDVGEASVSGAYAVFDPAETRRSLGIFTMLKEIGYSIEMGKEFYYLGYCYSSESIYDYKKRFAGTEGFDWDGNWFPFAEVQENP